MIKIDHSKTRFVGIQFYGPDGEPTFFAQNKTEYMDNTTDKQQSLNTLEEIKKIDIAAGSVSNQIAQIIPYLKQRQQVSRKMQAGMGLTTTQHKACQHMIDLLNRDISKILGL